MISGQATGTNGQPLVGVLIEAMRLRYDVDGRLLDEANGATNTKTDDRGQYRIFGLTPGEYVVRASPPTGSIDYFNDAALHGIQQLLPTGYVSTYFPNTFAPGQAAPIALDAEEEHSGVDFPLTPLPLANIHGILMGPAGPVPSAQFYRLDDDGLLHNGERVLAATGGDGRFVVFGLPQGLIGLRARAYPQRPPGPPSASMSEGTLWGTVRIAVAGKDVTGVTIAMQPGMTIRGVVKTESAEANVSLAGTSVAVRPASPTGLGQGEILVGQCDSEGRFAIGGVPSGSYHLLLVNAPAKWTVMSITRDGVDALSAPMDVSSEDLSGVVITLTDRPASLSGALRSEGSAVVADYTVIAFPASPAQRATRASNVYAARPGNDGRFSMPFVAPGEYLVALTDDIEPNAWFDPRVLERFAVTGIRVTVAKGEAKVQNLALRGGR